MDEALLAGPLSAPDLRKRLTLDVALTTERGTPSLSNFIVLRGFVELSAPRASWERMRFERKAAINEVVPPPLKINLICNWNLIDFLDGPRREELSRSGTRLELRRRCHFRGAARGAEAANGRVSSLCPLTAPRGIAYSVFASALMVGRLPWLDEIFASELASQSRYAILRTPCQLLRTS